jgi:hypothetical protein
MRIERVFAIPSKWTFAIPPIAKLIREEMADTRPWADPFAGMTSPAHIRNDINSDMPTEYHLDAIDFLDQLEDHSVAGVLFDPPYSVEMARRLYGTFKKCDTVSFLQYMCRCRDRIINILKTNAKVICCGWTSTGFNINRGFEMARILLVYHGFTRNDTIVTVERKIQETLI